MKEERPGGSEEGWSGMVKVLGPNPAWRVWSASGPGGPNVLDQSDEETLMTWIPQIKSSSRRPDLVGEEDS